MPLTNEQLSEISKPGRNLKIICGALLGGVCMFAVILFVLIDFASLHTTPIMLVALAAVSAAVMYLMSFIAFKVLSTQTKARNESTRSHFQVLQTAWIVRFAIIEGACFLNMIVTLLENSLITLFMAVLGILLMLIAFPRTVKVEELMEERLR